MAVGLIDLDVEADFRCEIDGSPLSIRAADGIAIVEVPDVTTGLKLLPLGSSRGSYVPQLGRFKKLLDHIQWQFELRLRSRLLVRLGWRTGSPIWKIVGLPPMHLSLRALLLR